MSLLDEAMEGFTFIDKTTRSDGYGGVVSVFQPGAEFKAALSFSTSLEARIASANGVTSLYTLITNKDINLQYHDIIRRNSTKQILRVTSNGSDNKTPDSAALNMRQVTAEEYELPGEITVIPNG